MIILLDLLFNKNSFKYFTTYQNPYQAILKRTQEYFNQKKELCGVEYGERKESPRRRERREGRRKATQRSNFCADLVRILVPHVLYFFTQFAFFS